MSVSKIARSTAIVASATILAGSAVVALATPSSASGVNWDAVAKCESGNRWNINTGNGYYGGLQFDRGTWLSNGGGKYGATANLASREQQIEIANVLYSHRGLSPWPVCGKLGYSNTKVEAPKPAPTVTSKPKTNPVTPKITAPKKAVTEAPKTSTPVTNTGNTYTVKDGDCLSVIGQSYNISWVKLYDDNKTVVGNDPDLIFPGQVLIINK